MKTTLQLETRVFPNLRKVNTVPARVITLHEEHYQASVSKANEILRRLQTVDRSTSNPIFSDVRMLKTQLQPIMASVKSYEIFFTHLGGDTKKPMKMLSERFVKDFGSHEEFMNELTSSAIASRGWVALSYDLDLKRLMVVIGDTPEQLTVWDNAPILVLEVSATSAALEYGGDRRRYVTSLLESVDWMIAERNLEDAIGLQPAGKPL
jgi:superoxide dismutase